MENSKIKILIADDNSSLSKQIEKYILKNTDFEIVGITEDGEEQIRMINNLKPNIVITDLKRNSGISGLEVIKRCYESGITQCEFLVATAVYYQEYFKYLRKWGVFHIVRKPFDFQDIIVELQEIQEEMKVEKARSLKQIDKKLSTNDNILKKMQEKIKTILRIGKTI